MKAVQSWVVNNPTRVAAIAMILIGWLALISVPPMVIGGLGTIVGILTGSVVWGAVTPIHKVVKAVESAATEAAAQAVAQLDEVGIGAVGVLTESGKAAVADATAETVVGVLADIGIKRGPPPHRIS